MLPRTVTVRFSLGPLLTFLNTGEVSKREVEEFILHPNSLKNLAPQGQGYLFLPDRMTGVSFETLPRFDLGRAGQRDLPRKPNGDGLAFYEQFVLGRQTELRHQGGVDRGGKSRSKSQARSAGWRAMAECA